MRNLLIQAAVRGAMYRDVFERKEGGGGGGEGADTGTRNESVRDVKNLAEANATIKDLSKDLRAFITKATGEVADQGRVSKETAAAVAAIQTKMDEQIERINKIEAKYDRQGETQVAQKTHGQIFIESPEFKAMQGSSKEKRARIEFKQGFLTNFETRAVVNATGQNQPLVPQLQLPGIITPQLRRLTIRDVIPTGRTVSNLVQYARELLFTNNAGPQVAGSPTLPSENALKPESDLTFELANAPVVTLAHFIMASRQVLDDAPMLESYIGSRLLYGLKLEEEDELLNGDGSAGQLDGLMHQAVVYNRAVAGDTKIDTLRRVGTQVALAEFPMEFYVLNPINWEEIELTKDNQGRYILARPESLAPPVIWGKPVIATQAITPGYFLGGNGSMAAQIWDRQDAAIELSREDGDNFKKNMVTILCEERLALTVYRPTALVKGNF